MSQSIICTKNRVCIWGSWNSFRFIHNTDIWRMCNLFLPISLIFIIVKIFEFVLHCHLSFGMSLETWNKSIYIPLRRNLIAPFTFLWCLFFLLTVIHNYKWRTAWNQSNWGVQLTGCWEEAKFGFWPTVWKTQCN